METPTATTEQPKVGDKGPFGRVWNGEKYVAAPKAPAVETHLTFSGPPPVAGEVLESQDDVLKQLAEFASLMGDAVKKKSDTKKVLDQVADLLNGLDTSAYAEVLAHPVVEKLAGAVAESKAADPGVPPGTDLGPAIGKKPWTIQDYVRLAEQGVPGCQLVEVHPRESLPVTINGVTIMFIDDQVMSVPACFRDVYDQHRKAPKQAQQHIDYMFRRGNGAVDDPTIISTGSQRVRGRFSGGLTGVGMGMEIPDHDRPGFDDIGGTEVGDEVGAAAGA